MMMLVVVSWVRIIVLLVWIVVLDSILGNHCANFIDAVERPYDRPHPEKHRAIRHMVRRGQVKARPSDTSSQPDRS